MPQNGSDIFILGGNEPLSFRGVGQEVSCFKLWTFLVNFSNERLAITHIEILQHYLLKGHATNSLMQYGVEEVGRDVHVDNANDGLIYNQDLVIRVILRDLALPFSLYQRQGGVSDLANVNIAAAPVTFDKSCILRVLDQFLHLCGMLGGNL